MSYIQSPRLSIDHSVTYGPILMLTRLVTLRTLLFPLERLFIVRFSRGFHLKKPNNLAVIPWMRRASMSGAVRSKPNTITAHRVHDEVIRYPGYPRIYVFIV